MMSAIRTPGSIWAKCIEQASADAKKPDGRGDGVVYFVGSRLSGKSTLLNRFLYPTRVDPPKSSEGLEYTYARRPSAFDHEKKDMAHIWEIGGSPEFALEIVQGDQIFLTAKQVTTAVVVIVVDLSDPASVLPTALYWLDQVKKKLASTYEKFEKKGLQLPEQLRTRAKSKLYSNNDDKDLVYHSGISIVIAATKYDAFRDSDPEVKKVVARTLRFVAHANGAFLTYIGGLHSTSEGAGKEGPAERALLDNFTRLMNHLIFTGLEKKPSLKMAPAYDHQSPLMVPAGTDKFKDIGRPRGGGADLSNIPGGLAEWRELFEKMFPPKEKEKAKGPMIIDERYKDDEIDAVRSRKLQELDSLRKEVEMAKEYAKKKAALAKAQAAVNGGSSNSDTPEKPPKSSSRSSKSSAKADTGMAEAAKPPSQSKSAMAVQPGSADGGGNDDESAPASKPKRSSKHKTAAVTASPQAVTAA